MQYSALQVSQAECVGQPGSQQQVTALGHQLLLQSQFRKFLFLFFLLLHVKYFQKVSLYFLKLLSDNLRGKFIEVLRKPRKFDEIFKLFLILNKAEKI